MEFQAWPKTPRLFRDVVITEKIDGTNAAVIIEGQGLNTNVAEGALDYVAASDQIYSIGAQSRKRLLTVEEDNFGFAKWVAANAEGLVKTLGEGRHYGEWWGSGIQRGYGLTNGDKRFSLFNVKKWAGEDLSLVAKLGTVPVLSSGITFNTWDVEQLLIDLMNSGSKAAPGFPRPEGICIFHSASGHLYKYTENDETAKGVSNV